MNNRRLVEDAVIQIFSSNGFVSEDKIVDLCIDFDLELNEIDTVCNRLLSKGIIIRDSEIDTKNSYGSMVDRSHTDYKELHVKIKHEHPEMSTIIETIDNIVPPQTKEWQTLLPSAKKGNSFAKERIISMYLRTVLKQAYMFATAYNCDLEEMFQWGVIGLIVSIDKFDINSPDNFVSYFPLWVRQSMQREGKINDTLFYYPVHYKDKLFSIIGLVQNHREEDEDIEETLAIVDDKELCAVEENKDELQKLIYHLLPPMELTNDISQNNNIEELIDNHVQKKIVNELLGVLNDREAEVIIQRYGFLDEKEKTLEDVGSMMNVTRERIRQIESKALRKMKIRLDKRKICINDTLY